VRRSKGSKPPPEYRAALRNLTAIARQWILEHPMAVIELSPMPLIAELRHVVPLVGLNDETRALLSEMAAREPRATVYQARGVIAFLFNAKGGKA